MEYDGRVPCRDGSKRWSASDALAHPWLDRLKAGRSTQSERSVPSGIVQRIQRFGSFNEFKRAALEQIAERCLLQSMGLRGAAAASSDEAAHAVSTGAGTPTPAQAAAAAAPPADGALAVGVAAEAGGKVVKEFVGDAASLHKAQGLLEHMMVTDGTV